MIALSVTSYIRQEGGELMSTMEILTLLLVVFAALTYLDSHKK